MKEKIKNLFRNNRKKIPIITLFIFVAYSFFGVTDNACAHPGRTTSDGCHYCRTRCDCWRVAWNQEHCHDESTYIPMPTYISLSPDTSEPEYKSESEQIKIDTSKSKPQSVYTAQIHDEPDKSYVWVYWLLGIAMVGGIGLSWIRKK